jgi:hypothetical protein
MSRLYFRPIGTDDNEEMIWLRPGESVNVKAALALGLITHDKLLEIKHQEERKEAA